jgi:hypothetical protein
MDNSTDATGVSIILRGSIVLGVVQAVCVFLVSLINKAMTGTADAALTGVVVAVGSIVTMFYPAMLTRPRTIEGIAGAAGIGLGAALAFLVVDVALLQPLGTYTNRWYEVGGGSNWWYHPTWWMVGCYLSWLGAWIFANQANKNGAPSLPGAVALVAILTAVVGAAAAALHFPGASFNVPTFSVAVLPALTLGTWISGFGASPR